MSEPIVIHGINGPVVTVEGKTNLGMMEMVYVGDARLVGEVIGLDSRKTTIQVYEETGGLRCGQPVYSSGGPMCVTLGPGILRNIYDGIQRPLPAIQQQSGAFIGRGSAVPALDPDAKWDVTVTVNVGDRLEAGQIYATCPETPVILHKCMLAPGKSGKVVWTAPNGSYTVNDTVVKLENDKGEVEELTLCQRWPIRTSASRAHPYGRHPAADHRSACHRHHVPHRQGRRCCHSRRFRYR